MMNLIPTDETTQALLVQVLTAMIRHAESDPPPPADELPSIDAEAEAIAGQVAAEAEALAGAVDYG